MKRWICLMLAAYLCLPLAACGGAEESSVAESSEASVEEESVAPPKMPVIGGSELSEFAIVYSEVTDIHHYKAVAEELYNYIHETFGLKLEVYGDMVPEAEKEIIIGATHRRKLTEPMKGEYGYGGYKVQISGTKVGIAGSQATGCYQGVEALIEKIQASEDGVFNDQTFEGEGKVLKVACVGDSITQGINSTKPSVQTYPVYIQQMLGYDYYVLNAGLSGYSICKTDEYAYWKSNQYTQAKNLRPDIVIFHLGTNDANPGQPYKNWEDHDRMSEFVESTKALLDSFVAANKDVQTFVVLPASLFKVGADSWNAIAWTEGIVKYVHPTLKEIAAEYNYPTVDMFDWSLENKAVFTDGLHPKDETYKTYAQHIYDCIKDTIKKPE